MKRTRETLESDLKNSGWEVFLAGENKVFAFHSQVCGSDGLVKIDPAVTVQALQHLEQLKSDESAFNVFLATPSKFCFEC